MSERSRRGAEPIRFGEKLAASQQFSILFREGMALVEETAAYLDGDGRAEAKALVRQSALAYATESMRLTTRLMQLASWLLLHRAVNEGEMSLTQARKEKTKVRVAAEEERDESQRTRLPAKLQELIEQSLRLQRRVILLDTTIHAESAKSLPANPIERQLELLRSAFPIAAAK
jgi:regulator of CtrA degradation